VKVQHCDMRSLRLVGEKTSLTDNNFPDNNDVLLLGAHKIKKNKVTLHFVFYKKSAEKIWMLV